VNKLIAEVTALTGYRAASVSDTPDGTMPVYSGLMRVYSWRPPPVGRLKSVCEKTRVPTGKLECVPFLTTVPTISPEMTAGRREPMLKAFLSRSFESRGATVRC
jgi:hypothetical protein